MMETVDILITGGRVVTMDEAGTIHGDGAVAIDRDAIVAVGPSEDLQARFAGRKTISARNHIVMPGLVNGHTHAAMTCFRGIADDMELMSWLNDYMLPAEARNLSPELVYWGTMLACAEMIKSGTTTFCDMYIFEDEAAQAAKQAGMRCLVGEVLYDFPSANIASPAAGIKYTRSLIEKWSGDPLVQIAVQPHALYTCADALLKDAKALARDCDVPYAVHFLENQAEVRQLNDKYGKRAILHLRDLGCLDEKTVFLHGVCMDEEDIAICADHGCKVVHNPESNMKLACGVAPVAKMLSRGLAVALGTDGCASNNNLDMFQEMDTAAKLAKVAALDPTLLPAPTVVRMATATGAYTLGMGGLTGVLAPGKKADVILINTRKPHLTPLYNEYSHLVYAVTGADVETVIINGKTVMEGRRIQTLDEEEAMKRVNELAVQIKNSFS
ncbi:MAG TPA: amidohydrolase [Syntrophales bacterium]|jgi:5-methylthioadenosine/S-adenosylhomocysteine deaminase|nr:amidohydrolase [Syntrophales bacterium]HOU76608.1 amidohydrolase [Syntrophales bacterium]HPC31365.1 amidohydrolase [Syntrophales bacterium]HQG33271.1 amidohydrolase [Syntrophales bacterium]HQI35047.1 amidohydrolase [Syntrophales bacterium]